MKNPDAPSSSSSGASSYLPTYLKLPFYRSLKTILASFYPSHYQEFYRFLSNDTVNALDSLEDTVPMPASSLVSNTRWMENIHYSWFLPYLETVSKESLPFFLSLFPPEEKKELRTLLNVTAEKEKKPTFPLFLLAILYKKIYPNDMVPQELLTQSTMSELLHLSKKELILLTDLLGIYDLAFELRQVVDKNLLKKIYEILSKDELAFLQIALKQPIKWTPPKLNLSSWDGQAKPLRNLLHFRGLFRLAMATYEEEKNFQWHLSRKLDIGRGKVLLKFYAGNCDREMIPYFRTQILDIIKRFGR